RRFNILVVITMISGLQAGSVNCIQPALVVTRSASISGFRGSTPAQPSQKKLEAGTQFVGKYDGKTNNGIPCFVEKRLLERACQKLYRVWQKTDFTNDEDVRRYWRCIDYVESTLKMALLFETTEEDEEDYRQFLERLSLIKNKTRERLETLLVDRPWCSETRWKEYHPYRHIFHKAVKMQSKKGY
ncbi:peptidase, partial [Clonorchis sinensis]